MSTRPYFVGVDVGGQSIKGGVVDDTGQALSSVTVPTEAEKGQQHGLHQMCEAVRVALSEAQLKLDDVAAIGIATPGTMDIPAGMMLEPVNMPTWKNVPVRQHIADTFQKPTAFQNDANAAAYGEYWAGIGRDAKSMVLFTLGTGIGCGIIINDYILEGEHSHGAECGHLIIEVTPPSPPYRGGVRMCGCGQAGHLEAYASALSIVQRTRESLAAQPGMSDLDSVLRDQGELTARDIFDAAMNNDHIAAKIIEDTAYYLAVGAVNLMHTINPNMVVFGGGMIACGEWFLDRIRYHVKRLAFPVPAEKTLICYAKLGSDAGFVGAAGCARLLMKKN